ncbi:hypothetical protein O6H91_Y015400 [Diphasiastrum complanatum]|nr:hypothetical protein O6H91_Y015400 [Diphasiastrum complanatum]
MHKQGHQLSAYVFYCLLKGCTRKKDLATGRRVRCLIVNSKYGTKTLLGNHLIHMFSSGGSLLEALHEFRRFAEADVHMWSAIISAHAKHGKGEQAIDLYNEMCCCTNVVADSHTYVAVLNGCASIGALTQGRLVHSHILESGLELDPFVGSSLVDMYSKCGSLDEARQVFLQLRVRDVVCWTSIIDACAKEGYGEEALHLFEQMQKEGVEPNKVTLLCVLKACNSIEGLQRGMLIHEQISSRRWDSDTELGNALIDMYAKCGNLPRAFGVFLKLPSRNVVSWTTMITGLAQKKHGQAAFQLFAQMQEEGVEPNKVTFVGLLKACCSMGALDQGKLIHAQLVTKGLDTDLVIGNILIDMYARCGSINNAWKIFLELPERDIVSWNAMINACAQQGHGKEALYLFEQMKEQSVQPDKITFLSLLCACSHTGLIGEGFHLFDLMSKDFGIIPSTDHYTCMIDLLGRAGKLYEAHDFINAMPLPPDAGVWLSLLGACRTHGNFELGKLSFKSLVEIDPRNAAAYMLMGSIYSACGRL